MKVDKHRQFIQEHIHTILFDLTLPLLLLTEAECNLWQDNQIEFVRLQIDKSNDYNVKRTNEDLVTTICSTR